MEIEVVMDVTDTVLNEVKLERKRQLTLWGNLADNENTRNDWAAYICRYASDGAYNGKNCLFSEIHFRECLIKAAAICAAAIEAIDRLGKLPETEMQKFLGKG